MGKIKNQSYKPPRVTTTKPKPSHSGASSMIPFQKSYLGLKILFRVHGSAMPRILLPATLSAVVAVALVASGLSAYLVQKMPALVSQRLTVGYTIFTTVSGFVLIFRTQVCAFLLETPAVVDKDSPCHHGTSRLTLPRAHSKRMDGTGRL